MPDETTETMRATETQEPSTKACELIRLFGDAEFQCGEWDNPDDVESYESVWHDARMQRNALYAYIAELEQRAASPGPDERTREAETNAPRFYVSDATPYYATVVCVGCGAVGSAKLPTLWRCGPDWSGSSSAGPKDVLNDDAIWREGEFHVRNGLTFQRTEGGVVVRLHRNGKPSHGVYFSLTILPNEWESVVREVSPDLLRQQDSAAAESRKESADALSGAAVSPSAVPDDTQRLDAERWRAIRDTTLGYCLEDGASGRLVLAVTLPARLEDLPDEAPESMIDELLDAAIRLHTESAAETDRLQRADADAK